MKNNNPMDSFIILDVMADAQGVINTVVAIAVDTQTLTVIDHQSLDVRSIRVGSQSQRVRSESQALGLTPHTLLTFEAARLFKAFALGRGVVSRSRSVELLNEQLRSEDASADQVGPGQIADVKGLVSAKGWGDINPVELNAMELGEHFDGALRLLTEIKNLRSDELDGFKYRIQSANQRVTRVHGRGF